MISGPRSGSCSDRGTGRRRHAGILGQAQLEQVAGRHGAVAADHHNLAEQCFQGAGGVTVHGCGSAEDAAQEPARTVNADEAGHPVALAAVRGTGGKLGHQFGAELALDFLNLAALAAHGLADLFADLVPETFGLRGGERLELQAGAVQVHGHGHHALGCFFHLEPELQSLAGCDQEGAKVHVAVTAGDFGDIKGPGDAAAGRVR